MNWSLQIHILNPTRILVGVDYHLQTNSVDKQDVHGFTIGLLFVMIQLYLSKKGAS